MTSGSGAKALASFVGVRIVVGTLYALVILYALIGIKCLNQEWQPVRDIPTCLNHACDSAIAASVMSTLGHQRPFWRGWALGGTSGSILLTYLGIRWGIPEADLQMLFFNLAINISLSLIWLLGRQWKYLLIQGQEEVQIETVENTDGN
jgi:hypothetical protein